MAGVTINPRIRSAAVTAQVQTASGSVGTEKRPAYDSWRTHKVDRSTVLANRCWSCQRTTLSGVRELNPNDRLSPSFYWCVGSTGLPGEIDDSERWLIKFVTVQTERDTERDVAKLQTRIQCAKDLLKERRTLSIELFVLSTWRNALAVWEISFLRGIRSVVLESICRHK